MYKQFQGSQYKELALAMEETMLKAYPSSCITFIIYHVKEHPKDLHSSTLLASLRLLHPGPNNPKPRLLPSNPFPSSLILPQPSLNLPLECSKSNPQVRRLPLHRGLGDVPFSAGWRDFDWGLSD